MWVDLRSTMRENVPEKKARGSFAKCASRVDFPEGKA